jgi:hypothetical protein
LLHQLGHHRLVHLERIDSLEGLLNHLNGGLGASLATGNGAHLAAHELAQLLGDLGSDFRADLDSI